MNDICVSVNYVIVIQIIAGHLFGIKPVLKSLLTYFQLIVAQWRNIVAAAYCV